MKKAQLREFFTALINDFKPTVYDELTTLTQVDLTELTDLIAVELGETVNPNGPCYPTTPR